MEWDRLLKNARSVGTDRCGDLWVKLLSVFWLKRERMRNAYSSHSRYAELTRSRIRISSYVIRSTRSVMRRAVILIFVRIKNEAHHLFRFSNFEYRHVLTVQLSLAA